MSLPKEDKETPWGITGALKWMHAQGHLCRGEKRDQSLSPWLIWRDVLLLYPHFSPSAAPWHCDSTSLQSKLDKDVPIIHKIHKMQRIYVIYWEDRELRAGFVREDEKLASVGNVFILYTVLSNSCSSFQQGARGPPGPKVGNE